MRTYDLNKIVKATSQYSEEIEGFDPEDWLSYEGNVALINDNDDIALFERQHLNPVAVYGHYFFFSRGSKALKASKQFLEEIYRGPYNVEIILGLTPTEHKGALWMNKQLGFKTIMNTVETVAGNHVMVMLTKKEWEQTNDE